MARDFRPDINRIRENWIFELGERPATYIARDVIRKEPYSHLESYDEAKYGSPVAGITKRLKAQRYTDTEILDLIDKLLRNPDKIPKYVNRLQRNSPDAINRLYSDLYDLIYQTRGTVGASTEIGREGTIQLVRDVDELTRRMRKARFYDDPVMRTIVENVVHARRANLQGSIDRDLQIVLGHQEAIDAYERQIALRGVDDVLSRSHRARIVELYNESRPYRNSLKQTRQSFLETDYILRQLHGEPFVERDYVNELAQLSKDPLRGLGGPSAEAFRSETAAIKAVALRGSEARFEQNQLFQLYATGALPSPMSNVLGQSIPFNRGELAGQRGRLYGEINYGQLKRSEISGRIVDEEDAYRQSRFGYRIRPENIAEDLSKITFERAGRNAAQYPILHAMERASLNTLKKSQIDESMGEAGKALMGSKGKMFQQSIYTETGVARANQILSNTIGRLFEGKAVSTTGFGGVGERALGSFKTILRGLPLTSEHLAQEIVGGVLVSSPRDYQNALRHLLIERHKGNEFATKTLGYIEQVIPNVSKIQAFQITTGKRRGEITVEKGYWNRFKEAVSGTHPALSSSNYSRLVAEGRRLARQEGRQMGDYGASYDLMKEAGTFSRDEMDRAIEFGERANDFLAYMGVPTVLRKLSLNTEHLSVEEEVTERLARNLLKLKLQQTQLRIEGITSRPLQELESQLTQRILRLDKYAKSKGDLFYKRLYNLVEDLETPLSKVQLQIAQHRSDLEHIKPARISRNVQDLNKSISDSLASIGQPRVNVSDVWGKVESDLERLVQNEALRDFTAGGKLKEETLINAVRRAREMRRSRTRPASSAARDIQHTSPAERMTEIMLSRQRLTDTVLGVLGRSYGWTPEMAKTFKSALVYGENPLFYGASAETAFSNLWRDLSDRTLVRINQPGFEEAWHKITGLPASKAPGGLLGEIVDVKPLSMADNLPADFRHIATTYELMTDASLNDQKRMLAAWRLPEYEKQWAALGRRPYEDTAKKLLSPTFRDEALALAEAEIRARGTLRVTQQSRFIPMAMSYNQVNTWPEALRRIEEVNERFYPLRGKNVFGPKFTRRVETANPKTVGELWGTIGSAIQSVNERQDILFSQKKAQAEIAKSLSREFSGDTDTRIKMLKDMGLSPTGTINEDLEAVAGHIVSNLRTRFPDLGKSAGMYLPEYNSEALDIIASPKNFGFDLRRVLRLSNEPNTVTSRRNLSNLAAMRDVFSWGPESMGAGYKTAAASRISVFDRHWAPVLGNERYTDALDTARSYLDEALQRRGLSVESMERLHEAFGTRTFELSLSTRPNEDSMYHLKELARQVLGYSETDPQQRLYPILARGGYPRLPGESGYGEKLYESIAKIQYNELFSNQQLRAMLSNRGIPFRDIEENEYERKYLLHRLAVSGTDIRPEVAAESVAQRLTKRTMDLFDPRVQAILPDSVRRNLWDALLPSEPGPKTAAEVGRKLISEPDRSVPYVRAARESFSDLMHSMRENRVARYGAITAAGIASLGIVRSIRTRDHTPEDVSPAADVMNMSTSQPNFTSSNGGFSPTGYSGVTYHITANGVNDPVAFKQQVQNQTGGTVSGRMYNSPNKVYQTDINKIMQAYS